MDSSLMSGPPGTPATRSQRWLARLSFALAALAVVIVAVFAGLKSFAMLAVALAGVLVAIVSAAAWLLAGVTARSALAGGKPVDWRMPERPALPPASHPYLIMNP